MGNCGSATANNATENTTAVVELEKTKFVNLINIVILAIAFVAMLIKIPGLVCLFLSTRVKFHVRLTTLNVLIAMMSCDVCFILFQVLIIIYGSSYTIFKVKRFAITSLFIVITWSALVHMAVDKVLLSTQPRLHTKFVTKRCTLFIIVVFDWLIPVGLTIITILSNLDFNLLVKDCYIDGNAMAKFRMLMALCYAIYNATAIVMYVILHRFLVNRHRENPTNNTFSSVLLLIKIIISSTFLQAPHFLEILLYDILKITLPGRGYQRFLSFLLITASMLLNTFLFLYKLEECRYHFMRIFLCCFNKYKEKAQALRAQIYR